MGWFIGCAVLDWIEQDKTIFLGYDSKMFQKAINNMAIRQWQYLL